MTFSQLLDQIVVATGDKDAEQRNNARRWLNLTRNHIADEYFWPTSIVANDSITVAGGSTSGVFPLSSDIEAIYGDWLYNATDNNLIKSAGLSISKGADVDRSVTGPPEVWADAGMEGTGKRRIYLWPIPSVSTTIEFSSYKKLVTLDATDDNLEIDPYFGDIQQWAACFTAGMRFYSLDTDNEDAASVDRAEARFMKTIEKRKKRAGVAPQATTIIANIKTGIGLGHLGRFDPAHFNNRG